MEYVWIRFKYSHEHKLRFEFSIFECDIPFLLFFCDHSFIMVLTRGSIELMYQIEILSPILQNVWHPEPASNLHITQTWDHTTGFIDLGFHVDLSWSLYRDSILGCHCHGLTLRDALLYDHCDSRLLFIKPQFLYSVAIRWHSISSSLDFRNPMNVELTIGSSGAK